MTYNLQRKQNKNLLSISHDTEITLKYGKIQTNNELIQSGPSTGSPAPVARMCTGPGGKKSND